MKRGAPNEGGVAKRPRKDQLTDVTLTDGRKVYEDADGRFYAIGTHEGFFWYDTGDRTPDGFRVIYTFAKDRITLRLVNDGGKTRRIKKSEQDRLMLAAMDHRRNARVPYALEFKDYVNRPTPTKPKPYDDEGVAKIKPEYTTVYLPSINPLDKTEDTQRVLQIGIYNKLETKLGNRVKSGQVVATRGANMDLMWFDSQVAYLRSLSVADLLTAAAYAHRSWAWIGQFQQAKGWRPSFDTSFYKAVKYVDMSTPIIPSDEKKYIRPLFPQMVACLRAVWGVPEVVKTMFVGEMDMITFYMARTLAQCKESDLASVYLSTYVPLINREAFSTHAIECALRRYEKDLHRIIQAAPPATRDVVMYRGTAFNQFTKTGSRQAPQFTSASFVADYPLGYADGKKGTLLRLTVKAGTKALLLAPLNKFDEGEYEVVFDKGSKLQVDALAVERFVLVDTGQFVPKKVVNVTVSP